MQTENKHTGTAGPLKHPESAEWMGFLYGEPGERRRELRAHLEECPACSAQLKAWRASMSDLDEWRVPTRQATSAGWMPVLRWATAAAAVLAVGMGLGRITSPSTREVAELKASVAQLSQAVRQNTGGGDSAGAIAAATTAANVETMRLLTQYSALQENQRTGDQLALKDVLDTFDARLASLRHELETVAVNTEGGFQATRQNMARLVSFQGTKEQ
jgi:hypothetical protein